MADTPHDVGSLRADIPVPLPPAGPVAAAVRRLVTTLRGPAFGLARRRTPWLLGLTAVVLLGQFAVVAPLRPAVVGAGAGVAVYAVVRDLTLVLLERRQRSFVPEWLAEQSRALRSWRFELLRCTVDGRGRDLDDPGVVRELGAREDNGRVVLDFTGDGTALERVHRGLREIEFRQTLRPGAPAAVWFPEARYELQPSGQGTFWRLGRPVVLTSRPGVRTGARAGTRSTGRPDGEHPTGGRRPGRS